MNHKKHAQQRRYKRWQQARPVRTWSSGRLVLRDDGDRQAFSLQPDWEKSDKYDFIGIDYAVPDSEHTITRWRYYDDQSWVLDGIL